MLGEQNSVPTPLANADVWLEVLKYFEIALGSDSVTEIQEKRRAAIKVAVLSPGLTGPALDTLWRSMTTLEPVVRVINAAASPNNKFITYPIESACWVLRRAPTKYQRERVVNYLYRVQNFHAGEMGSLKETTLWPTLVACLAIKTNSLLPNLRSLYLSCDATTATASWINIPPLLSSNIQFLSLFSSSAKIAEVIVTLLQVHAVLPANITYRGNPNKKVVQSLIHHAGLEILKFDFEGHTLEGAGSSTPILQLFNKLTHLKELQLDLRFFPIAGVEDPALTVQNLRNLEITGSTLDLWCLLESAKFPSLDVLKVAISHVQVGGLRWGALCSCVATATPHLQHLSLRMLADSQIVITLQDLKLFSNLDLRSLHLVNVRHGLMRFDFGQFGTLWPNLQVLSISESSDDSFMKASDALTPLARHPGLRIIELSLDFAGSGHLTSNDGPPSHSQITDIICARSKGTPTTVVGTLKLVQNLLRLFPNLRRIHGNVPEEGNEGLATVQMAITTVRELLSYHINKDGRATSTI